MDINCDCGSFCEPCEQCGNPKCECYCHFNDFGSKHNKDDDKYEMEDYASEW